MVDTPKAYRPLFFVGNKRSGTSLLVQLLNASPDVFVSHEADSVWILYQLWNSIPLEPYAWDGSLGFNATLSACQDLLNQDFLKSIEPSRPVADCFTRIQLRLMHAGSGVQVVAKKPNVLWLGDKKPVQHCDPRVRPFLRQHFADARYIHAVRHPAAVVRSMQHAARTWARGVPEYWRGSEEELLDRWATHEEWVVDAAKEGNLIVTVRLEDVRASHEGVLAGICEFLGVKSDWVRAATSMVLPPEEGSAINKTMRMPLRTQRLMDLYGYE